MSSGQYLGQNFFLVDLREFFSDLGSGGRKKINKKGLKMTSCGHFQNFFFFFFIFRAFFLLLIYPEGQ